MKSLYFSIIGLLLSIASFGQAGVIVGPTSICPTTVATYTDSVGGGAWSVGAAMIATISAGGVLTPVSTGVETITYTVTGGYYTTLTVTINAAPAGITGPTSVCTGSYITMADATGGGVWSVGSTGVATIGSTTGVLTGIVAGVTSVSYTVGTCSATTSVTVGAAIAPIVGGAIIICDGSSVTLTDTSPGGTWASSAPAIAAVSSGGIVTGISSGVTTISYTSTSSCGSGTVTTPITVSPLPAGISGPTTVCAGSTITLTDVTAGGTWTSTSPGVFTIDPMTGILTGTSPGTATASYTIASGCYTSVLITVGAGPMAITGSSSLCMGSSTTFSDLSPGGTWASSDITVASLSGGSVVNAVGTGTAVISYTLTSSCGSGTVTRSVTVSAVPTVTATVALGTCGAPDTLSATGAATYYWSPFTLGYGCDSCAVTTIVSTGTTAYTVTGSMAGCAGSASVTIDGNKINGHITFSSATPPVLDMKVWLIQFNPTDSSLIAQDSTLTCLDGGTPFYQFMDKPAGSYLVKAKLLSSVAGTSGYLPTYGASTPHWDSAATVAHSTATDGLDINMLYGTVPSGPGFIGGLIVSGAGKGTSGEVPAPNMLVYLEDATTHILTYAITDATGAYSFSGLAYGTYIIYPVDYKYATTPSSIITLSATSSSVTAIDFKQHTTLGTITPFVIGVGVGNVSGNDFINLYPNPTKGLLVMSWQNLASGTASVNITDMLGRSAYQAEININATNGNTQLDLGKLSNGIYFINIKSADMNYSGKLQIVK